MKTQSSVEAGLERLTRQFGAPGRISFAAGPNDLPIVRLASPFGSAEFTLYGAQLLTWRPIGHAPVLYLSPKAVYQPGQPIRGGIPICFPWFGAKGSYPRHGFARTCEWRLKRTSYDKEFTQIEAELLYSQETLRLFPHHFQARLEVTLGRKLFLEFTVLNLDEHPFDYTEALHPYLALADTTQATITPLDIHPGNAPIDRNIPLSPDGLLCELHDPTLKRDILIEADDCDSVQIWNPAAPLPDIPPDAHRRFLCVEPANTLAPVHLNPGEQHTLTLRLQPRLA
ncbi:MAG: D-hexose-6-phosphate mutarotase [Kiritimatiellia bacterium]|nr:D-hexose-6-phosphate mutarotase [Kiritimatiellia bacterium]